MWSWRNIVQNETELFKADTCYKMNWEMEQAQLIRQWQTKVSEKKTNEKRKATSKGYGTTFKGRVIQLLLHFVGEIDLLVIPHNYNRM